MYVVLLQTQTPASHTIYTVTKADRTATAAEHRHTPRTPELTRPPAVTRDAVELCLSQTLLLQPKHKLRHLSKLLKKPQELPVRNACAQRASPKKGIFVLSKLMFAKTI